uniref:Uncharacterized protein n=1 Tax=uncultured marine bacterium 580 TaxID=257400 RepID=Q6SFM9_9BACT|nr:hypothetical protein MBMO_EBAC000-36A07.28 [uncultured marine bacterium 580]
MKFEEEDKIENTISPWEGDATTLTYCFICTLIDS